MEFAYVVGEFLEDNQRVMGRSEGESGPVYSIGHYEGTDPVFDEYEVPEADIKPFQFAHAIGETVEYNTIWTIAPYTAEDGSEGMRRVPALVTVTGMLPIDGEPHYMLQFVEKNVNYDTPDGSVTFARGGGVPGFPHESELTKVQ